MDKTFVYCNAIWASVLTVALSLLAAGLIIGTNNDHNFDTTCINAGKSVTYKTLEGDDYSKKVCQ